MIKDYKPAEWKNYSKFKDQITGKPMYDCAFQWYEEEKKDAHKQ